ncbi:MAG: phosphoheptose isomerase [Mycobacterium sp.]|jgi:D-sedoheptulose 7-phosphate isomerase|nr:phosphoheptose isomerase [Mycobacterium sp.]
MTQLTTVDGAYGRRHVEELGRGLDELRAVTGTLACWGSHLAGMLAGGGRLLAAGNGGSAAQAQHLTAELVGRYRTDRPAYSAIALHAETSSLTAVANDYGVEQMFARQVEAHGRPGDVLVLLSTSGRSPNLLVAAEVANHAGMLTWAVTGPAPNPLAALVDEALCLDVPETATVQELHLVALHILCAEVDRALGVVDLRDAPEVGAELSV